MKRPGQAPAGPSKRRRADPPNLTERRGDLLTAAEDFIAHQVNCVSAKPGGGGLSERLFRQFPHADQYAAHAIGGTSEPGSLVLCGGPGGPRGVANLCCQRYPGRPKYANDSKRLRQEWFGSALRKLGARLVAERPEGCSVAFPDGVGCGLAGGDWPAYREMIVGLAEERPELRVAIVRFDRGKPAGKRPRMEELQIG